MLYLLEAILLGVIQGITEFLPVSSSGHLLLAQYFLGLDQSRFGLSFDVALHLGTLLAVVAFFWWELLRMARAFLRSFVDRDLTDPDQRLAYLILASTVPAVFIGYFFEGFFSTAARSPLIVAFGLALVGVMFIVAEAVGRKSRFASKLGFGGAFGIGLAQAAALIPGVSRSGATITLGLFLGLRREEAARFSFLMSVPVIAGAGLLEAVKVVGGGVGGQDLFLFGVGFVCSAVVGYLAIKFFISYVADHSLRAFAYYRFALAAIVVVALLVS